MAFIKISELRPVGSELFQDSESFLNELNDKETVALLGGELADVLASLVIATLSLKTVISIKSNTINANSISQVKPAG